MNERVEHLCRLRTQAAQINDWNMVKEIDHALAPYGIEPYFKPTLAPSALEVPTAPVTKRGPGRPKKIVSTA